MLRFGIVGLGTAGRLLIPALEQNPDCELVAVSDLVPDTLQAFAEKYRAKPCADLAALVALPEVDVVYVATPTHLHADHVVAAIGAGKHVIVEKPMAASLADAQRMSDAAKRKGVHLVVGHTHAYDLPIHEMGRIVASGELGKLKLINTSFYTDWFYRPRLQAEFDAALGGGVVFRQGSHQFDIVRVLGGGMVSTVRAVTFELDPQRPGIGAYTALLTFANGVAATVTYNGYGFFGSAELVGFINEGGHLETLEEKIGTARRAIYSKAADDERDAKRKRIERHTSAAAPPHQAFFGITILTCERGDIRQSPDGLYLYTIDGRSELVLPRDRDQRTLLLAEICDTIAGRRAPLHDGAWGVADVEVCLAVTESSQRNAEVTLQHQVAG